MRSWNFFFVFQEFGYDLTKHPRLADWYVRCQSFPGFQENVDGAKFLAQRMFAVLDDKFWNKLEISYQQI